VPVAEREHARERAGQLAVATALACAALSASTPAQAIDPSDACRRAKNAEGLFQCGKRLLDSGHLEAACETLARSERMEPSVGTLGLLATCNDKLGRTATARRLYLDVAERARQRGDDRERFARERAQALATRVPQVVVEPFPGEWPTVRVAGTTLERAELGSAIEVDPGVVLVEAVGSGGDREEVELRIVDGERRVVRLPALEPKPEPEVERSAPPTAAWVAAGIGATGLVVMGVTGSLAIARNADSNDAEPICRGGDLGACADGREARDEATTFANVATASFVVGVSGLAAGAVLWLLDGDGPDPSAPSQAPVEASLAPLPGGGYAGLRLHF
jgi:hypothetical protein